MTPLRNLTVLAEDQWLPRERAHQDRARPFTEGYLRRRSAGKLHPVEDFLFSYYTQKPGQLLRWHPGAGVVLTEHYAMFPAAAVSGWYFAHPQAQYFAVGKDRKSTRLNSSHVF